MKTILILKNKKIRKKEELKNKKFKMRKGINI